MNRRNFIKRGALFVPSIFVPRLIRSADYRSEILKFQAWQKAHQSGGGGVNMTVDFWQSFESTIDSAGLDSTDHATGLTWTVVDASSRFSANATGQHTSPSTINTLTDSGTQGLKSDASGTNTEARYLYCTIGQTTNPVSIGFFFFLPTLSVGLVGQAVYATFNGSAQVSLKIQTDGSDNHVFLLSGATDSSTVGVSGNAWYWVNILSVANGTCKLRIYDTSGVLQGSEVTCTGNNQNSNLILLGNINSYLASGVMYYDNLVANWSTAPYPLKPW